MDWSFNFGWVILGLVVAVAGGLIVINYKRISDNFAHGISSYDRVKLIGIITVVVGLVILANLHTLILSWIVNLVFKR